MILNDAHIENFESVVAESSVFRNRLSVAGLFTIRYNVDCYLVVPVVATVYITDHKSDPYVENEFILSSNHREVFEKLTTNSRFLFMQLETMITDRVFEFLEEQVKEK